MSEFASQYFAACQGPVLEQAREIIRCWTSADQRTYGVMVDYLQRRAKGLRPGLCIAVCRALGGSLEEVLPSAAVVELFHNAFLIHDDIEDGSLERRGAPALHQSHGTPIALNIGDGLLALALRPLLTNTEHLGLARTLQILEIIVQMVTESFEGQAMELRWIADGTWDLSDADYEDMVRKKTCVYSFIAPAQVGAVVARAPEPVRDQLTAYMQSLGLAFQIQDDLLNLERARDKYGKEYQGDLWEGKRTLMLLHALREASTSERTEALQILSSPRPQGGARGHEFDYLVDELHEFSVIDGRTKNAINSYLAARAEPVKSVQDVSVLRQFIDDHQGVEHARSVAARHAEAARVAWQELSGQLSASVHTRFLAGLTDFVVAREH